MSCTVSPAQVKAQHRIGPFLALTPAPALGPTPCAGHASTLGCYARMYPRPPAPARPDGPLSYLGSATCRTLQERMQGLGQSAGRGARRGRQSSPGEVEMKIEVELSIERGDE